MEEVSFFDLWKKILKRKWLMFIVFSVIFISTLLLIFYIYNPLKTTYEVTFRYSWFGIENKKYADGTVFNPYVLASKEKLLEIKKQKTIYQTIDIDKVVDHIDLKEEEQEYILKISGDFFENDFQAKSFITDIIFIPYEKAIHLNFDFKANIEGYERAKKISTKIEYLNRQKDLIVNGYQKMIAYFGNVEIEEMSISGLYKNLEVFLENNNLKEFEYIAYQNVYMTKEEYQDILIEKSTLKTEQDLLRKRKEVLLDSLKNIYTNSNGNTYMDNAIANYLDSLHKLDSRLIIIAENLRKIEEAILGKYEEEKSIEFIKELDLYKTKLIDFTDMYQDSVNMILEKNTFLYFQPIVIKGRLSFLVAIIISILVGFFFGCIGVLFTEYFKKMQK